jgi:glycine cleavage system H protein
MLDISLSDWRQKLYAWNIVCVLWTGYQLAGYLQVLPADVLWAGMMSAEVHYKRSRFTTHLLEDRLYTAGHSWLEREGQDLWRVGFTKFAIRMLGEIVELGFEKEPGSPVETGQVVGWLEGFKAVTDIFSPLSGHFEGCNPALDENLTLLTTKPYTTGWLFKVRGRPEPDCLDVHGYVSLLDATIDKMLGKRHELAGPLHHDRRVPRRREDDRRRPAGSISHRQGPTRRSHLQ